MNTNTIATALIKQRGADAALHYANEVVRVQGINGNEGMVASWKAVAEFIAKVAK